ncbi:MAG: HAMP domain-containing histidine kinase, partial [Cyclobacteriaceae bacterium]|nr:HAMP domain-containing histidine kinase [Cyclobacteriaceae bacterium]
KDNGIGMTNEVIAGLFKANNHMSTRGTENEKGTGLGLKLCKEFLDKYNGHLEVESKIGEGSTFTVKLKNAIPVLETLFN